MDSSYNENSTFQNQAFEHFWPWLEDAVTHSSAFVPFQQSKLISYADFGCATGANSAASFAQLKCALEQAGFLGGDGSSQLQVTLVDLPSNDWNQVASAFCGPGAVGCAEAIVPCMVPKSFYAGEIAPPATIHIGISVDALQWLSHAPAVSLKDSMMYQEGGQAHVEAYKRQFEADAEHFLRLRATEFAAGGLLLLVLPGTLGDRYCGEGAFSAMSDAAAELCAQGKIDASLLDDFLFPVYMATEDELESIVYKAGNWEVLQRGGASLTALWDAYRASEDAAAYAKVLASMMRGVCGPLMQKCLAINEETLQELFERTEALIKADPSKYSFKNIQVAVLLRRTRRRPSTDIGRRSTE